MLMIKKIKSIVQDVRFDKLLIVSVSLSDGGTITTIFLFVVISANLILTIHFYLSWRKGYIFLIYDLIIT